MISTRCRDNARFWNGAQQQIRERAAGLKRTGMLQRFELQNHGRAREPEVACVHSDDGRTPDVRGDQICGRCNPIARDGVLHLHA
jgi:hypothetical protein